MIKKRCRNIFENVWKHKLDFKGHTCKELQKPSVTKTYSAGFNHNPELSIKKRIRMIRSFWKNVFVNDSSILIGLENFGATVSSIMGRLGWYSPINQKMTKSSPIRVPSTKFLHPTHKSLTYPPNVTWNRTFIKSRN